MVECFDKKRGTVEVLPCLKFYNDKLKDMQNEWKNI